MEVIGELEGAEVMPDPSRGACISVATPQMSPGTEEGV